MRGGSFPRWNSPLASKKQTAMLWTTHGEDHVTGHRVDNLGAENGPRDSHQESNWFCKPVSFMGTVALVNTLILCLSHLVCGNLSHSNRKLIGPNAGECLFLVKVPSFKMWPPRRAPLLWICRSGLKIKVIFILFIIHLPYYCQNFFWRIF